MVPANVLDAARAAATAALDMPGCEVQYATSAPDGYGHEALTWTTSATVACSLRKPSAALMQAYAARIGTLAQWVVHLPYGTVCTHGDRLLVAGQTLTVEADLSISSYATNKTVLAAEVMEG